MAKKTNFKEMNATELGEKLADFRESIRSAHFKSEGARSKNVKEQWALKKNVARILTILSEKKNAK